MSLKARLEAARSACEADANPAVVAAMRHAIQGLREAGIAAHATKAGDIAPAFAVPNQRCARVTLSGVLRRGPAVISFLRGHWCAFCALELRALAEVHPEIERLGATLVALVPHANPGSPGAGAAPLPFPVLLDTGCEIASLYGITYSIPVEARAAHVALGYPKPARDVPKGWRLPIPATYVVGTTGRVVLSYLDVDYTTRLEPAELITVLTNLRAKSASYPGAKFDRDRKHDRHSSPE